MHQLEVRKPVGGDLNRLVELQKQAWDYHHEVDALWNSSSGQEDAIHETVQGTFLAQRDGHFALVMVCDGEVVGYATAEVKKKGSSWAVKQVGHIGTVFIEAPYRQLGLGKMAVEHFVEIFRDAGIRVLSLNVDVRNERGVAAWKRMGFEDWRLSLRKDI